MRQIIATSGGFSNESDNLALDRYVLNQTGKIRPKVCFLPTASGDSGEYIRRFYAAFGTLHCEATHQPLFESPVRDVAKRLLSQDVIYVGGGNSLNMLAIWRAWSLDEVLQAAWGRGIVLAGMSAGALCWFDMGLSALMPGTYTALRGLGFLSGSLSPHYNGQDRRSAFHRLLIQGEISSGYGLDDGTAMHYVGQKIHRVLRSHNGPQVFRVEMVRNKVVEVSLRIETV